MYHDKEWKVVNTNKKIDKRLKIISIWYRHSFTNEEYVWKPDRNRLNKYNLCCTCPQCREYRKQRKYNRKREKCLQRKEFDSYNNY